MPVPGAADDGFEGIILLFPSRVRVRSGRYQRRVQAGRVFLDDVGMWTQVATYNKMWLADDR